MKINRDYNHSTRIVSTIPVMLYMPFRAAVHFRDTEKIHAKYLGTPPRPCVPGRYGRVNALLTGLVTLALATALYGAASSVFWLFVASGLHGTSLSFIHISSLALLSAFPDRITEGMGGIEVQ